MPDQKSMRTRCLGGFSVMWVTKLLISPVKKRFFAPKRPNLAQNWHFWSFCARGCRLIWCPVGGLVSGCGARAVSRKTPIYFILATSVNITFLLFLHHRTVSWQTFEIVLSWHKFTCQKNWTSKSSIKRLYFSFDNFEFNQYQEDFDKLQVSGHITFETVTSFLSDFHHEDREVILLSLSSLAPPFHSRSIILYQGCWCGSSLSPPWRACPRVWGVSQEAVSQGQILSGYRGTILSPCVGMWFVFNWNTAEW